MVFIGTGGRMGFGTRSEGGCTRISGLGVPQPLSFISLSLLWLSPVNRTRPCRTGEKGGDESDPAQKRGGHVTPDSGTEYHTAIRPHAGRSRPHISLREGSEQPPGGGADGRETDL